MRINNNISAINTHRQVGIHTEEVAKSVERLSSGYRINRAGDDAAGLAISEKMRAQIRGLIMASKNAQDAISMIQTAEGALAETHSILQRIRELAVQSANDTNTDSDRSELQAEVKQLLAEINRIGNTTEFNTKKLLEGSAQGVADEIKGAFSVNNNSSLVLDSSKTAKMGEAVARDKNWAFDGAYALVRTGKQKDGEFNAEDFMLVGPNGAQYKFTTLAAGGTNVGVSDIKAGTIVSSGKYIIADDPSGTLSGINVTIGNDTALTIAEVASLAAGSVLADGSAVNVATELKLMVSGKEVKIEYNGSGLKVGGELVAVSKSITLEDGTILKNEGGGKVSVVSGSIKLAQKWDVAAGDAIAKDSTLTSGSEIKKGATLEAGTVITNANVFAPGSITFAEKNFGAGDTYVQFSSNAGAALAADYKNAKVGDSITFLFSRYKAPSSNLANSFMVQIGANSGQTMFIPIGDMRAQAIGVANIDISTKWGAETAIETVDNAIQTVSHQRSALGAFQNRLEHTIKSLETAIENLQAAESRIRDVDMMKEIMEFTKNNILLQVAQAMLAQANSQPKSVLALLRDV
jgi:flagellin